MAASRRPFASSAGALALGVLVWSHGLAAPGAAPRVSDRLSLQDLWLAPSTRTSAHAPVLEKAAAELAAGKAALALPAFARATSDPAIGGYARLNAGRAELALKRPKEAAASARIILKSAPTGYLREAALWLAADAAEALTDWPAAVQALTELTRAPSLTPQTAWLRLGLASEQAGDRDAALRALTKVYYDFPLTADADTAAAEMATIVAAPLRPTPESFALDFRRAQQVFAAGRYADARKALSLLRDLAGPRDRTLIDLRVAECNFFLGRYASTRDALRTYVDAGNAGAAEAEYYYLSALRELGQTAQYVALARTFIDASVDQTLVELTLNDLGTYYILADDDARAAAVFGELYRRFPAGAHADRAAWHTGWWAYRTGDYEDAARVFESAAAGLAGSDYRPSWLYWAARARLQLGQRQAAARGFRGVVAEYRNSYYGREAARLIDQLLTDGRPGATVAPASREAAPAIDAGTPPPNAPRIRALLAAGLYDDAIGELKTLQLASGTSPLIEATIAYALNRRGDVRAAITTMRHAYPQFLTEGGDALPADILTIIFPVDYWNLVYKYATAHKLDPYLMAALIKQESTFEPTARSAANAWGLMQVLPSTGRRYARTLGIRGFRTSRLTDPETNIRIGMAYFADLVKQFGDVAPAVAAYNAGDARVARWVAERPGLDADEFIDDIPYPETRSYVKRVLGSADDYRALYRRPR
jgi:peptidoglycan lytic transglycosylase